jgi:hypothetical protein
MHRILIVKNGNADTSIVHILNDIINGDLILKNKKLNITMINSHDHYFISLNNTQLEKYIKSFIGVIILGGVKSVLDIEQYDSLPEQV